MANKPTSSDAAHNSLLLTSDFITLVTIIVAWLLERHLPLTLPLPTTGALVGGGLLIMVAVIVLLRAKIELKRSAQPTAPGKPTTNLVMEGLFARSRNPMYVALLLGLAGFSIVFQSGWLLILLIPVFGALRVLLIRREERYLARRFGQAYRDYCQKVRRWV